MVDRDELAQQLWDLAAVVGGEIGAHPGAQVRRLPHVEHAPVAIAEHVHAGRARQPGGEGELRGRGMRAHRRQRQEVVEAEHPVARGALEQRVQHLGGRGRVGVGAVRRLDARAEVLRQCVQSQVRDLVAHEPARERERVDTAVREPRVAVRDERGVEERAVETDVVPDDHRVARELEERRQDLGDERRGRHHVLGDAGEHRDHRRDGHARIDERLEAAEQLAAAQLERADLGDRVGVGRSAGGLEVDDDERRLRERRAQVGERLLAGPPGWRRGRGGEAGQPGSRARSDLGQEPGSGGHEARSVVEQTFARTHVRPRGAYR